MSIVHIFNVATKEQYTVNHIAYADAATDIAAIVINESNDNCLHYDTWSDLEAGTNVVIIGNPLGDYGKVITGTIADTDFAGFDKLTNALILDADIQEGSSGSPVLDSNGFVMGMVWGVDKRGNGKGIAATTQTLWFASLGDN